MRIRNVLFILVATLAISSCSTAAKQTVLTWTVDGVQRQALVFIPANVKYHSSPVVFAWHGYGSNMQDTSELMQVQTAWKEAIVIYPQGLQMPGRSDTQPGQPGWQVQNGQLGNRDLKFFDAMLDTMHQQFRINDKQIYSMGFSNGAGFTYLQWSERGKLLAALGICAGRVAPSIQLTPARPVVVVGGSADQTVQFSDQQKAIAADRTADNATGDGQSCGTFCTLYPSTTQTPVETVIHDGGHIFPPFATTKIIEFFKAHPLP